MESASFLVGYLLGLPSCPFAPSAAKPLEMLAAAGNPRFDRAVDRTLIWLLAPTALESLQSATIVEIVRNSASGKTPVTYDDHVATSCGPAHAEHTIAFLRTGIPLDWIAVEFHAAQGPARRSPA